MALFVNESFCLFDKYFEKKLFGEHYNKQHQGDINHVGKKKRFGIF